LSVASFSEFSSVKFSGLANPRKILATEVAVGPNSDLTLSAT
jgi:hypothetical protein